MLSGIEVCEKRLFAKARRNHLAILTECNAAAGVNGLDDPAGLECRLDIRFVCHLRSLPVLQSGRVEALRQLQAQIVNFSTFLPKPHTPLWTCLSRKDPSLPNLDNHWLPFLDHHSEYQHTITAMSKMNAVTAVTDGRRIPVTIITGFAGSGKTTLVLNLVPQLRAENPGYKLALIKNEIGDLNVDTQLAAAAEMTGSKELLGDCICCTNVGQIEDALATLDRECQPDRIIIETSGSAEPLKLVLEVNRISKATGRYELDGIVSVIDAENWSGYASTSYTAKLQAKQTDLIVINKWESLSERAFDLFLDKLGDLDVDTPQTKSDRGWLSKELLFGFDPKMARSWMSHHADHVHDHKHGHTSEMECLSVTLTSPEPEGSVDLTKLDDLLKMAPKDEVYRIKAVLYSSTTPKTADGSEVNGEKTGRARYILNWSFGRWTWSHDDVSDTGAPVLRMSIFTAQYESNKWLKRIEGDQYIALAGAGAGEGKLDVKRVQ